MLFVGTLLVLTPGCNGDDSPPPEEATSVDELVRQAVERLNQQVDADGDGILNGTDQYPYFPNQPVDTDGDGLADHLDLWPNHAGVPPQAAPTQPDYDGDGIPDDRDSYARGEDRTDSDGDGTVDAEDTDPYGTANDAAIRAMDSDGDYIPNVYDESPFRNNFADSDSDGYTNYVDPNPTFHDDLDRDNRFDTTDDDPYDPDRW